MRFRILFTTLAIAIVAETIVITYMLADKSMPIKPVNQFTMEEVNNYGIKIITDPITKCEYVLNGVNSITPRMYSDGIQVCGDNTYPNGASHVQVDKE